MNKWIFVTFAALVTLSCSVSTAAQTAQTPASTATAPAKLAQANLKNQNFELENAPNPSTAAIYALGTVYVRSCPSTACRPLGAIHLGGMLTAIGKPIKADPITGELLTANCSAGWIPVRWRNDTAWTCADWWTK